MKPQIGDLPPENKKEAIDLFAKYVEMINSKM